MFWVYLIAAVLAYSLTRNVFLSVCLGFLSAVESKPASKGRIETSHFFI
jgi:hypothetical protein